MDQFDALVSPHREFKRLGKDADERCAAYRALFKAQIPKKSLEEIRASANKNWVLGSAHFKEKIEKQLNRRGSPLGRGGDRKSEAYRESKIDRV